MKNEKPIIFSFIVLIFLLTHFNSNGQDIIEEVKEEVEGRLENPFRISGTLGVNLGFYQSYGIEARRDQFSYLFIANANASILGFNIPVTGNLSQLEAAFLQPFNQIGFSPSYKWATVHAGYRNMTFSPLTLNGHTFLGIGVELEPPTKMKRLGFRYSAMFGRFRRPVDPVKALEAEVLPAYKRMGYGFKVGMVDKKEQSNYLDFILFRGYDAISSIQQPIGNDAVKPQDNLVLGISGQYKFFDALVLKTDWAVSALTRDKRSAIAKKGDAPFTNVGGIFNPRISTQVRQSVKTSLSYSLPKFTVGVKYNYIAPDYITLGSYFFQNDLEDYSFSASTALKEGKIMLSGNIGFQRNNLDNRLDNQSKRVIGSLAYNHMVSSKVNIYANYSNFSSSLLTVREELSDTLNFYQVTTNYTLGFNYNLGSQEQRQSLAGNASYQIANARDEYSISDTKTSFYTAGLFYNRAFKKDLSLNAMFNYTRSQSLGMNSSIIGPGFGLVKKFPDQNITARYFLSYRNNFQNGGSSFSVVQNRLAVDYKLFKHHNISVKLGYLNKIDGINSSNSYGELQGMTSYLFNF